MHSSLIGKVEKANRYARELDRISIERVALTFRGDNDTHHVSLDAGQWHCTCHYFESWGSCVHLLALQKIFGVMLPEDAQVSIFNARPASAIASRDTPGGTKPPREPGAETGAGSCAARQGRAGHRLTSTRQYQAALRPEPNAASSCRPQVPASGGVSNATWATPSSLTATSPGPLSVTGAQRAVHESGSPAGSKTTVSGALGRADSPAGGTIHGASVPVPSHVTDPTVPARAASPPATPASDADGGPATTAGVVTGVGS